ncbi:MAG: hypothetical protein AABX77_03715 [Nanoarchaeota archaeon]
MNSESATRNLEIINDKRIEYEIADKPSGFLEFHVVEKIGNRWKHYCRDSWETRWYQANFDEIPKTILDRTNIK